ncbi:hypothetical protein [Geomesophilobacter sediminis]|uniref:Glycosyltransferase RgtA/B/C/D-like domain-containing protein n=1 Tax=Geomesophilobacter sediminis TaxID=2798584 RepID=A0A8J7M292_9BACT|nr:hypothetical protein [Geomesophilobacter sediminis]MBJ6727307.1 hypothetical protein [Geomesophilobacter sediminis]
MRSRVPLLVIAVTCILVLLQETFAPFANGDAPYDPGVYTYCAQRMLDGELIYRDLFDHKGPLLHLLHAAGLYLFNRDTIGIWMVELAALSTAAAAMYFTARRLTTPFAALLAVILSLGALCALEPGGGSQFYTLPLLAVSLYVWTTRLQQGSPFSAAATMGLAACGTLTLLLQPNLVVPWLVFGSAAAGTLLYRQRYRELAVAALAAGLAAVLVLIPFLWYALHQGILSDAVACYWDFNRSYAPPTLASVARGTYYTIHNLNRTLATLPLFLYAVWVVATRGSDRPALHLTLLAGLVLTLVVSCGLSGRNYAHYAIIILPFLNIALAFVLHRITLAPKLGRRVALAAALLLSLRPLALQRELVAQAYRPAPALERTVAFIKTHTAPGDRIAVVGNDSQLYYRSGRQSSSRYHYTIPLFDVPRLGPVMAQQYRRDLFTNRPRLVVVTNRDYPQPPPFVADILETGYRKLPAPDPSVSMYLRKQDSAAAR